MPFYHIAAITLSLSVKFEIIKGFGVSSYPDVLSKQSTQTDLANDVST